MLMMNERAASNLRWYYTLAGGDLGLKSNFGSLVARLEGRSGGSESHEIDSRRLEAAARARRIAAALSGLEAGDQDILRTAFAGSSNLDLLGVMASLRAAHEAHRESRSARDILDWLARMATSSREGTDVGRRRLYSQLRGDAEQALEKALSRFVAREARRR